MQLLETFKTREAASEKRQQLAERGIEAKVVVDPMESRAPALATYHGVALLVQDGQLEAARALGKPAKINAKAAASKPLRKAS